MRLIETSQLKPGMVLAQPIYDLSDGRILLYNDVELKVEYIKRLRELKYKYIYIKDASDNLTDIEILEPIKRETKVKATIVLKKTLDTYYHNEKMGLDALQAVVSEMIDQICSNRDVFYNLADIRTYDDYTFAHSVNVCVLSLMVGSSLQLSRNQLEILGIGAILHDVGKIFVENEIINKPGSLNATEFEKIKAHTSKGYEFLKDKISISYISAHIAYQHHERIDGSGYPRGLTEAKIHRFAKIVAVTDVYDAMTSQRVYRDALPSYRVLDELRAGANIKYDRLIVDSLNKIVTPYFIGSIIELNNGEKVVVSQISHTECWVTVLEGERKGTIFDLYRYPQLKINITKNG